MPAPDADAAQETVYPIAPARRRGMLFNIAAYAFVTVMAGGYFQGGAGWGWLALAIVGFVLFAYTLRALLTRPFVARIMGSRVEVIGPTGGLYALDADALTAATLDPGARVGILQYDDDGTAYALVSFRMMGKEAAADFSARIEALRPALPEVDRTRT
ncbi:MAG: hypothetical protein AAFP13_14430 [Pseudomonadota bacterium]